MQTLDTNTRTRLSEYKCKQWLKKQVVPLAENKKVLNSSYDPTLSFHHFPSGKNDDRRKQWLIKIRRDEGPLFKVSILIYYKDMYQVVKITTKKQAQTFQEYCITPTHPAYYKKSSITMFYQ